MHTDPSTIGVDRQAECRTWPLSVCLRRNIVSRGRWEADSWSLVSVISDRQSARRQLQYSEVPVDAQQCDYLWSGIALQLYRDERLAYRFNLSSANPRLFVICNQKAGLMQPFLVTASQDEAASYMDGGEEDVFSIAMPAAIQCWIEGFMLRHGEPDMAAGRSQHRHHGRRAKGQGAASRSCGADRGGRSG